MINVAHPANRGIVDYLKSRCAKQTPVQRSPSEVPHPHRELRTHPEIIERLWSELGDALPMKCNWVLYGAAVLTHPRTGIVFGFCGGSMTYALRLPRESYEQAIAAGATTRREYPAYPSLGVPASSLDLATFGPEWIFGGWIKGEPEWCMAAFEHAGEDL